MIVKALRKKLLVVLILFTMLFSNCGFTISAIASSEDFRVISKGIFGKDEIRLKAYFIDKDGNETSKIIGDVNEKVNLVLEVIPQVSGVLKNGTLRIVPTEENTLNFRISGTKEDVMNEFLSALGLDSLSTETDNSEEGELSEKEKEETTTQEETNTETTTEVTPTPEETVVPTPTTESEDKAEETVEETTTEENNNPFLDFLNLEPETKKTQDLEKSISASENSETENEVESEESEEGGNPFLEFLNLQEDNTGTETTPTPELEVTPTPEETTQPDAEPVPTEETTDSIIDKIDDLVDEEAIIARKIQEEKLKSELESGTSDIEIVSENEIELKYLKEETTIEVELEFVQAEKLTIDELMQNFKVQLSGEFINENLKTVEIGKEQELNIGWSYTNDFTLESEYTKFSPFEVGEVNGTIVENRVIVSRTEENKYLPVKNLSIEIEAPTIEGEYPTTVEVNASKLMATRGEDIGQVTFTGENWNYDIETHILTINVNNGEDGYAVSSIGEDEFIIIYRYEKYNEEEKDLYKKVKATVEEYNSPENTIVVKEINTKQGVTVDVGKTVTYSVGTTEEKVNKAKIYANYNSEEALYETEIKMQASINILTSDILENVTIDFSKDLYKDVEGTEFEAQDIRGKKIKFNYSEVTSLLENGGDITIRNKAGEVIYVLTSSLINSEEDLDINLNNSEGLTISINNVENNGIINFEVTKVIGKSSFEKSSFKGFEEVESTITGEVKYKEIEEVISLEPVTIVKEFEEAQTKANIILEKSTLSTLQPNEDVELKIQLNNNNENSDLYVNPSFEVVFPKYVKDVTIQSINLLYEEGLRVLDFETYTEDEILKMRVDLIGTQTKFVDFDYTNGTNIIFNLNIETDEFTPAKEDQIRLYYCNEGVTNYQTQTKWTIGREVPTNILNTKNGFDVALINYQAPVGLIVANGILNYDGNLSEIMSLKQGDISAEIPRGSEARIATMELLALNNTGNECTDVRFLGRVPFAGNKNVVTGEDLGTTTDTKLMDSIKANIENRYMTEIYYSKNPDATSVLSDGANGWTQSITDFSEVKSFLIEVKGTMAPGTVLQFTYDFEIQENLRYEESIAGSFGVFYNNNTDTQTIFESLSAEKVRLYTEPGMQMKASLSANIEDGGTIIGFQRIEYKITVKNNGGVVIRDVVVKAPIPANTVYTEKRILKNVGDLGYVKDYDKKEIEFRIDELQIGEEKEFSYIVTANNRSKDEDLVDGYDENGLYNYVFKEFEKITSEVEREIEDKERNQIIIRKQEVTELQPVLEKEYLIDEPVQYITNQVKVFYDGNINESTTNSITLTLEESPFLTEFTDSNESTFVMSEDKEKFSLKLTNETQNSIDKANVSLVVGNIYEVESVSVNGNEIESNYNVKDGVISFSINNLIPNEEQKIDVATIARKTDRTEENTEVYFIIEADGIERYESSKTNKKLVRSMIEVEDLTQDLDTTIEENSEIIISSRIKNIGSTTDIHTYFECNVPEPLVLKQILLNGKRDLAIGVDDKKIVNVNIPYIEVGKTADIDIIYMYGNSPGSETRDVTIERRISHLNQDDINLGIIKLSLLNDKKTIDEIEEGDDRKEMIFAVSTEEHGNYSISGNVWFDENRNSALDEMENGISGVNVYLYANNSMIKTTVTDRFGKYTFNGLDEGDYVVGYNYNNELYQLATYRKTGVTEENNSEVVAVEQSSINAITNKFSSSNNIKDLNMGLQVKDSFDFKITNALVSAKVKTTKGEKEYLFEKSDIAKIELKPNEMNGAHIEFKYEVTVENIGNIAGYAEQIFNIIMSGMNFDEKMNPDWNIDDKGMIYSKKLNNILLRPGEKASIEIILTKDIEGTNAEIVQNRVQLTRALGQINLEELTNNNIGIQSTFISISTGNSRYFIIISSIIFMIILFIYLNQKEIIDIKYILNSKKKIYKNSEKNKTNRKKLYK